MARLALVNEQGDPLDTSNRFMVSGSASRPGAQPAALNIRIWMPPKAGQGLTVDEALNLAAWLVAVSFERERFDRVLEVVENS